MSELAKANFTTNGFRINKAWFIKVNFVDDVYIVPPSCRLSVSEIGGVYCEAPAVMWHGNWEPVKILYDQGMTSTRKIMGYTNTKYSKQELIVGNYDNINENNVGLKNE